MTVWQNICVDSTFYLLTTVCCADSRHLTQCVALTDNDSRDMAVLYWDAEGEWFTYHQPVAIGKEEDNVSLLTASVV